MVACFVGTSVHAVTSNFADLFDTAATSAEGVTHGAAPKFCGQFFVSKKQKQIRQEHSPRFKAHGKIAIRGPCI